MADREEMSSNIDQINNTQELIGVINKLQDAGVSNSIKLPQIVMLGSQSAGKSSVLESFVGRPFLPRGTGIVTRCPLVLQLIECKNDSHYRSTENEVDGSEEWGEFLHCKDKIFTDFNDIRKEIEAQTDRLAGKNKGICAEEIHLKFYSPNVVNLTLVDLPGTTKVAVGDQPEDIEEQIKKLVMKYIENPNSIILSISAANADLATSESLKFAKDVDPDGKRTLAVLTKIDLMDPGTDAWDMLNGKLIPVKLGIVGVVNRSQKDINSNKTIHDQLKNEGEFFEKNYKEIADQNGIQFLAKKLNKLLINHIHECLPKMRGEISSKRMEYQEIFDSCGEEVTCRMKVLVDILTKFTNDFNGTIDGTSIKTDMNGNSRVGGPHLRRIFDETFINALEKIEPEITNVEILQIIKENGGPRPDLFAQQAIFEKLVKEQIERFREPSINCLILVFDLMNIIIVQRIEAQEPLKRFPLIALRVREILKRLLEERLPIAKNAIKNQIDIELASINTNHPNFSIEETLKDFQKFDSDGETTTYTASFWERNKEIFMRNDEKNAEVIEKLIKNYFPIVKKTTQDLVPKIIMHFLVNYMKEEAQSELIDNLYIKKDELLSESQENAQRRDNAFNMLVALKKAEETINQVNEIGLI